MTLVIRRKLRHGLGDRPASVPAVLTVAGSDSSGGAGIEADLKTFAAHKVYGLTCITALTAQNTTGVSAFTATPKAHVQKILQQNLADFVWGYGDSQLQLQPLRVVKTGMLTTAAVEALCDSLPVLKDHGILIVVDPVMVSTSGSVLSGNDAMILAVQNLIPESDLVTPNFKEAVALLRLITGLNKKDDKSEPKIKLIDDFAAFVIDLQKQLKCKNLLVKGGHIPWNTELDRPYPPEESIPKLGVEKTSMLDILYESETETLTIYESQYIPTTDSHGTGCTLASAIAANMALGNSILESVGCAADYVHQAMSSTRPKLGHGNGPVDHNVVPETSVCRVIVSETDRPDSYKYATEDQTALDYFITHPKIETVWKKYTNHGFLKSLATNKLPYARFIYYLKQDYHYLINYARVHAHAAAVAPSYEQTHAHAVIISDVVNEIERHKKKLCKRYDIIYERDMDLDIELQPGKACVDYCNYLLDVVKTGDFVAIKVALSPCLHGYRYGGDYARDIRNSIKDSDSDSDSDSTSVSSAEALDYGAWIDDYTSEWYLQAHQEGIRSLDSLLRKPELTQARLDYLVSIFADVTALEVAFWDEVLQVEEEKVTSI